jgi:hypothetical protein
MLAFGQLLSVIPPNSTERCDLEIAPERGWKGQTPTWFGVPCRIGGVTIWLPTLEGPAPLRSFPLLALFPRQDIEDAPPFVHLGTQFLLEHRAKLSLNASSPTGVGRLVFP